LNILICFIIDHLVNKWDDGENNNSKNLLDKGNETEKKNKDMLDEDYF
jgi:hypothetical protein